MMTRRYKKLAPDLITIPSGSFLIGSTFEQVQEAAEQFGVELDWFLAEVPQHCRELPAFQISRNPITCADYGAFIVATDHPTPAYWRGDEPPHDLVDHPVVGVSYNDVRFYCQWLTAATGLNFRLPGEAEWEKAARGEDGRVFPWGDVWDSTHCNTAEGGAGGTTAVESCFQDISPYGCLGMAGNVEEWTADSYGPYPGSDLVFTTERQFVIRGGCWNSSGELARCASRRGVARTTCSATLGFRVVCGDEW